MDYDVIKDCGVIKAITLPECSSIMAQSKGLDGPVVGKIPVVIAEPVVQVVVEACIDLPEPVFEIKRIKKNLFINQCKLIDLGSLGRGKLFLSGYIRKNIEYATPDKLCKRNSGISGDIKHLTVNIPFTCVTEIIYAVRPQIIFQGPGKQAAYNLDCKKDCNCGKEENIGRMPCEDIFEMEETFNEPVFCELEEATFFESDIHDCCSPIAENLPGEIKFDKITEKIVLLIRLKLLQKQQVNIGIDDKREKQKRYV